MLYAVSRIREAAGTVDYLGSNINESMSLFQRAFEVAAVSCRARDKKCDARALEALEKQNLRPRQKAEWQLDHPACGFVPCTKYKEPTTVEHRYGMAHEISFLSS